MDKSFESIITPEIAWGNSTGAGVNVAVIDSGIDEEHPDIKGSVKGGVEVIQGRENKIEILSPPAITDDCGHGTACAGIIKRIAPHINLYSVKVLSKNGQGRGEIFLAGLQWAIENGMDVINLSLGTTNRVYTGKFFKLLEDAYYNGNIIVCAAKSIPSFSLPSVFSSVISVSYEDFSDTFSFVYHRGRKIEFDAPGACIKAPWPGGGHKKFTGTSFATPHITGIVALILSKHPGLAPFQVKALLSFLGKK